MLAGDGADVAGVHGVVQFFQPRVFVHTADTVPLDQTGRVVAGCVMVMFSITPQRTYSSAIPERRTLFMAKAAEAFRTISEVASDLEVPKHVLRFWEAKFPQIRPMKRGGGRRYYRPEDMELLKGIRRLLHAEGYTIKGVQKILREQGVDQVKTFAHLAAQDKSKARGKAKPDGVAGTAVAVPPVAAVTKARDGKARASETAASLEDIVRQAVVELDACRRLLLGEMDAAAAPQPAAARAGRG